MSTEEVKEPKTLKDNPKFALVQALWDKKDSMILDYKNTIKHTGSLVTASMTYAYSKALLDAIKLLTKEIANEEPVQTKEG